MLFLKDVFHDFALLPVPSGARLDYASLSFLAGALHKNATPFVSLPEFEDLASQHLSLTHTQRYASQHTQRSNCIHSRLYFELFALLFGEEYCLVLNNSAGDRSSKNNYVDKLNIHGQCLVPPTQFILFLFNQLYNRPDRDQLSATSSFNTGSSPRELVEGRNCLGQFWRENTAKWLNLVHLSIYGRAPSTGLSQHDVALLNFLFHTNLPSEFNQVLIAQSQFHSWILHNEEKDLSLFAEYDEELALSCSVEYALKATQVDSLLPSSSVTSGTYPLDFLTSWITWSMELKPTSFHPLQFTPNGLAYSSNATSSQGSITYFPFSNLFLSSPDIRQTESNTCPDSKP